MAQPLRFSCLYFLGAIGSSTLPPPMNGGLMMRLSHFVASLTLLVGCSHDLTKLRATAPTEMKEFAVPYGDLSTCTKQRLNKADPATHSVLENSSAGVTRLSILEGDHDALFEFTFVSQNPQITVIEFRSFGRDTRSDLVWKAIDECFSEIRQLAAADAKMLPTASRLPKDAVGP